MTALLLLAAACKPGPSVQDGSPSPGGDDTGQTAGTADTLVLLSLNLQCFTLDGTDFPTTAARFDAIAELAAAREVGVATLQEACRNDSQGDAASLLEAAFEAATGQAWASTWAEAHTAWEGTEDEAAEGLAILARTDAPLDASVLTYAVQGSLARIALQARLPAELGGLAVTSVHLDHSDEAARRAQARETAAHAVTTAEGGYDLLLAGDLYAHEGDDAHAAFTASGMVDLSQGLDPDRIDHAFVHRAAPWRAGQAALVLDGADGPVVSDHPGLLVSLEAAAPDTVLTTRLVAEADAGWGHWLAVRGDTTPLDWEEGWPATATADARWELASTEWGSGSVAYKWLRDDVDWQAGDNRTVAAGQTDTCPPSFE